MLKVALKNVWSHKFRSVALMFTVVLGVAFVSGTYVLTDTITEVFNDIFSEAYAKTDVSVRSESELGTDVARPPVPAELADTVREVPGVAVAQGGVFAVGADIIDANGDRVGNPMAPTFGLSWSDDESLSVLELREGRAPAGPGEVVVDASSFDDGNFALGDRVQVVTPTGSHELTIVGSAGFGRASNIAGATLAIFDLDTAQTVMDREGLFDSIDVRAEPGVRIDALQDSVTAVLPAGFEAVTGDQLTAESDEAVSENLGFFTTFLLVFAFIALFVGAFIIYNTFGIVVSQRTRELGLLRALGATPREVLASVVGESAVLGFLASVIGLGAGILLAIGLRALLAGFGFDVPSGQMVLRPRTILVALIGGTFVTTVSAVAPAVRAARVPPMAALHDIKVGGRAASVRRNILGAVLTAIGVVLVLSGLGSGGSITNVGLGALMTFVGVAMLAPAIARPVAGLVGSPIARFRGPPGKMSRQNAMRSARRTAATASALMIGSALMAGSLVLSSSMTESIDRAVSRGAVADLVVTSPNQMGFTRTLADEIRTVDGVAAAHSYRMSVMRINDATKSVTALPPEALDITNPGAAFDIEVRQGSVDGLDDGGIAVWDDVADDRGWAVGDDVTVTFPRGDRTLRVVAIYSQNTLVGDYVIGLSTFSEEFADQNDFLVVIRLTPGADLRSVQADIQQLVDQRAPGLDVQDRDQYIGDIKAQVNQFLGLITALLALAIIIALFGVLIAMLLAVFERTHELGLLRAVGMTRRQVRSMVRWEAAIVAVYGAALGLVLGLFFGLALTRALHNDGVTEQVVPVPTLLVLAVVIVLLGVAAAIYPARRAARLNVLEAISHH